MKMFSVCNMDGINGNNAKGHPLLHDSNDNNDGKAYASPFKVLQCSVSLADLATSTETVQLLNTADLTVKHILEIFELSDHKDTDTNVPEVLLVSFLPSLLLTCHTRCRWPYSGHTSWRPATLA
jgi:hypothetical protein